MNRLDFLNEKNNDSCCTPCLRGPIDPQGPIGPRGPSGARGVLNFADFYALMPPDNAATLGITPLAGGTRPVSAHLVITQIQ